MPVSLSLEWAVIVNALVYVPQLFGVRDTTGYWRNLLRRRLLFLYVCSLLSFAMIMRKLLTVYIFDIRAIDALLMLLVQSDLTLTLFHACAQNYVIEQNVQASGWLAAVLVTRLLLLVVSFVTLTMAVSRPIIDLLGDMRSIPELAIGYTLYVILTAMFFVVCTRNVADDFMNDRVIINVGDVNSSSLSAPPIITSSVIAYGQRVIAVSRRNEGRPRRAAFSAAEHTRFVHRRTNLPECAVCLEAFGIGEMGIELACSHIFHHDCLATWFYYTTPPHPSRCPLCRQQLR
jgi:Ring finger domain